ncbi:hypothetical protein [Ruegeria sp. HKCCD6119]|uniref:hypothetical protein n=1 Tax=Ruegeria sp. HKCCD6119 TaxID=2683003 RepID=UPI001490CAAB|nr:hypothetical protein [Ruegeria sp. HKCCD6119]NOD83753.1 hypothetical protein [Ruegeria sp. HKCCD6119]
MPKPMVPPRTGPKKRVLVPGKLKGRKARTEFARERYMTPMQKAEAERKSLRSASHPIRRIQTTRLENVLWDMFGDVEVGRMLDKMRDRRSALGYEGYKLPVNVPVRLKPTTYVLLDIIRERFAEAHPEIPFELGNQEIVAGLLAKGLEAIAASEDDVFSDTLPTKG